MRGRGLEVQLRASELQSQLVSAQLNVLKMQLQPHFLFNTLNGISTLILDNRNGIANRAVIALAEFLRYTLEQDPMKRVTLAHDAHVLALVHRLEHGIALTTGGGERTSDVGEEADRHIGCATLELRARVA